ncbi:hypothetical protein AX16_004383 [Volvariella volvacea WC 439]|nr:hypothetical protein AX16_004383 [Volvariella volvacea WC 439]
MPPASEGRKPRRLFSFDSIKSSANARTSVDTDSSPVSTTPKSLINPGSKMTLLQEEPVDDASVLSVDVRQSRNLQDGDTDSLDLPTAVPLNVDRIGRSSTPDPPLPSPSRARWEHLRQHVLPNVSLSTSSLSTSSPVPSPVGPRPQTPKTSRLARFGFRQVAEHVRDLNVDDTRKFGSDLRRAVTLARQTEPQKARGDKEATIGPYLPFMSTASLASSNTPNSSSSQVNVSITGRRQEPRRQSTHDLTIPIGPSLKHLYQTIVHYSTPTPEGFLSTASVPNEVQVLETLYIPFSSVENGSKVDEERWYAVEAFGIISKTWNAHDENVFVERCLWCCKVAANPSHLRNRVLKFLFDILASSEATAQITTPLAYQTVLQALFATRATLSLQNQEEALTLINKIITQVKSGSASQLDTMTIEAEYSAIFLGSDRLQVLRDAMTLEALTRCLANSSTDLQTWLLMHELEAYWPKPDKSITASPLLTTIRTRALNYFSHASLQMSMGTAVWPLQSSKIQYIIHILKTRAIPDIDITGEKPTSEARTHIVKFLWRLLALPEGDSARQWASIVVSQWYQVSADWKESLEETLRQFIDISDWPVIFELLLSFIKSIPDDVQRRLIAFLLPILNDRLIDDAPPYPCPQLTEVLEAISHRCPQVFFKPVFSCAVSAKEYVVVNHLCTITILAKFLPDFWTRDPEMVAVAIMSDIGGSQPPKTSIDDSPWGEARLGQSVLLIEVIGQVQALRHLKENANTEGPPVEALKFVLALETRLAILLEVREKSTLIPLSQRLLFCILFREMRLLTRSLKPAIWLSRVVKWVHEYFSFDDLEDEPQKELQKSVEQVQTLYEAARDGTRTSQKRRTTLLFSPRADEVFDIGNSGEKPTSVAGVLSERSTLLNSLNKGFFSRAAKLLVVVSSLLAPEDFKSLGRHLWYHGLSEEDPSLYSAVCFMIMQCAEKDPLDVLALIEVDLRSSDDETRLEAVRKVSILTNWRFQILGQHIADRAHRPFKLTRSPLPFVATDVGSSSYILEEDPSEVRDNIPLELRKRLAEIGWAQDESPGDRQLEWIKTPMSLLPSQQLDRLDQGASDAMLSAPGLSTSNSHKNETEDPGLLRRNSSSGGPIQVVKRRAVFVPGLSTIFLRLSTLQSDPNYAVASATRSTLMDLMRNDPALLARPVLDLFSGTDKNMPFAITTLRTFLHVRKVLPPSMAHYIFNHLAGFLKTASRQYEVRDTLQDYAYIIPILAQLVNQVSGMSLREIRRAKIDPLLIPTGSLWFGDAAPAGPMFPRGFQEFDPSQGIPPSVVAITIIRLSQNMLFLSMLKRNHQDVQLIRKNLSKFALPSLDPYPSQPPSLRDFIPVETESKRSTSTAEDKLRGLSLVLSRSYILLIAQVFRSMSRHLSDRNELSILVDGLNRILLAHGYDIGIVSQTLIALMVASTRFRRLFTTGGGYTLFMPALIKIYTESEDNTGIRMAIEYAASRFYALHQDAFVFQSIDIISSMTVIPSCDASRLARSVYQLFNSLRNGYLPHTPDAAGIHNINKLQEREALIMTTADEKPQTFLASIRRSDSQGQGAVRVDLPEEYEANRLPMDNFVKLFLTVIAHNPSIPRAEHFLHLFRHLVPFIYHASASARSVLQEGIGALTIVLARAQPTKVKVSDAMQTKSFTSEKESMEAKSMRSELGDQKVSSNLQSMKLDFLALAIAFIRAGGQLPPPTTLKVLDFLKIMLRDSPRDIDGDLSQFVADLTRTTLLHPTPPPSKFVVAFLGMIAPVMNVYGVTLDFTGVYETLTELSVKAEYINDSDFAQAVVTTICMPGLAACEQAASESMLLTMPSRRAFAALLTRAIMFRSVDIIGEIIKRPPSYEYLIGIIMPLVMGIRGLEAFSVEVRPDFYRRTTTSAWIRLLDYSMMACDSGQQLEEPLKQEKRKTTSLKDSQQFVIPTLMIAIQLIKLIVLYAQDEINNLPGVWSRISALLKRVLVDANGSFAFQFPDVSPWASPLPSPRGSMQFDQSFMASMPASPRAAGPNFNSPRMIDYAFWSLAEMLCAYRSPLMVQMRLFLMTRIVALDEKLLDQPNLLPSSPNSRRVSKSVFSKPRRRHSMTPSPNISPKLVPSLSLPFSQESVPLTEAHARKPGYQYSPGPSSPRLDGFAGPRIIHLGPVSNPAAFRPSLSPGGPNDSIAMAKSVKIKSMTLNEATYHRIRLVQAYFGYSTLLPLPPNVEDQVSMTNWTRYQAVRTLNQETKDLMEEFEVSYHDSSEDMVVVEPK